MHYVILGGGIAGTTAAEELRKADAAAEITIIEQEEHPCYSRVLLPHYIKGVVPREKVFLKTEQWYVDQRIVYLSSTLVTGVDTNNKFVTLHEGREIGYDRLLLTTGGEVNLADNDLHGVCYLATLSDADGILARLREVQMLPSNDRQAVVHGGGFIALEFINIFAKAGLATTVVVRGDGFWSRGLSAHAKAVMARQASAHGVAVITGQESVEALGDTVLTGVRLADGRELPAAIMGVGLGIHADHTLFSSAGIAMQQGILANSFLETNVPSVYTAGDAAEFGHPILGRQLQVGNWMNAQMQGRTVAKTMRGERTEYALVSSYATQLLGLHIVFIGDTNKMYADSVVSHKAEDMVAVDYYVRDGKIVGAVLVGDISERAAITKAITEGRSI